MIYRKILSNNPLHENMYYAVLKGRGIITYREIDGKKEYRSFGINELKELKKQGQTLPVGETIVFEEEVKEDCKDFYTTIDLLIHNSSLIH